MVPGHFFVKSEPCMTDSGQFFGDPTTPGKRTHCSDLPPIIGGPASAMTEDHLRMKSPQLRNRVAFAQNKGVPAVRSSLPEMRVEATRSIGQQQRYGSDASVDLMAHPRR